MQLAQVLGPTRVNASHVAFVLACVGALFQLFTVLIQLLGKFLLDLNHAAPVLVSTGVRLFVCLPRVTVTMSDSFVGVPADRVVGGSMEVKLVFSHARHKLAKLIEGFRF